MPVKLAVLGLNQGYKFAMDARSMEGVELVAVAGNSAGDRERASRLGVPIYADYRQLLEDCHVDGVVVALPNQLHAEAAWRSAEKGAAVLVEKPLAPTVDEGQRIIEVCRRYHVPLLVGHHRRFSSLVERCRNLLVQGAVGRVVGATMIWALAKDRSYFQDQWRISRGGGPLLLNGIHDIDTIRYMTGLHITRVYAITRNTIRGNPVEDVVAALMETAEGAVLNYWLSDGVPSPWSYEFTVRENPQYWEYQDNCYWVFGTEGSLGFPTLRLYRYATDQYGWRYPLVEEHHKAAKTDPLTEELRHFVQVIVRQVPPRVTGEDALETLKIIEAIQRSAMSGSAVNLATTLDSRAQ